MYHEANAIIREDNKPYCPECGNILGNIKESGLVEHKGNKYYQFKRYCSNDRCHCVGIYHEKNLGEERFIINDTEEVEAETIYVGDF